jgi:hypothetical protein
MLVVKQLSYQLTPWIYTPSPHLVTDESLFGVVIKSILFSLKLFSVLTCLKCSCLLLSCHLT